MDIVYSCYGGAHSSVVAASIHIGLLPADQIPSPQQLNELKYYDKVTASERGKVIFIGIDKWGNRIFICGRGREKLGIEQAVKSGIILAGGNTEKLVFVDTLPAVNLWMRIGGFISRRLKWVKIGRPLVIWGTQKAFPHLLKIVDKTKAQYGKVDFHKEEI